MGLFSSISRGIKSVSNKIKKGVNKAGKVIEDVGDATDNKALKGVGRFMQSVTEETAEKTGKSRSYDNKTSSVHETKNINDILHNFSKKLEKRMDTIENQSLEKNNEYFNYLIKEVKKINETTDANINIQRVEKYQRDIESKIKGNLRNYLSKRVSLDDKECLKILKMEAGKNKEKRMNQFGKKVIQEALEKLSNEIDRITKAQQELIEKVLNQKIDELILNNKKRLKEFKKIEALNKKDKKEIEKNKANIQLSIDKSSVALNNIRG
ncbi:hypothetical protein SAMN04515654_11516 [Halanaerobium congolense]|uniref:Uncharacterized protein n=1 Tax=Halanaerobium congolense TaxID=54121 RepID=A0A1G8NGM9_9FIRM|nr:hypothetical protein [Halanaerobium congolense]OEG62168.1 MAG: hypothetical protein BHK79_07235 [Halanaerobium sp. MDAL1]SDI79431.1 hypothetical protein SAMN04515654_11516 [Halanaerobium congolense]SET48899.1 hypothetical protein SAMN04515653_11616 [Halanaerobium congolense]